VTGVVGIVVGVNPEGEGLYPEGEDPGEPVEGAPVCPEVPVGKPLVVGPKKAQFGTKTAEPVQDVSQ